MESPRLQESTSFAHGSKEEPDSRGKRTAWESPAARLGAGVYTQFPPGFFTFQSQALRRLCPPLCLYSARPSRATVTGITRPRDDRPSARRFRN